MTQHSGRCPLCEGEKAPGVTTFAVDLGHGVVMVRRVPAQVCALCGEAWLDDAVTQKLEAIVDRAREAQAMVEVTDWPDVA
jgi:YgiT-type zinc finger domain-containing protein